LGRRIYRNAPVVQALEPERSAEWQPLKTKLVVEVQYDHFTGGGFGTHQVPPLAPGEETKAMQL